MSHLKVSMVCLSCLMLAAPAVRADVRTEERTRVEFPGALGGIVKIFGGKSAREGITNKVALKGNRKMTVTEETAELIDLTEEKVYKIDMKKKTYTVITFAAFRQQMEEAQAKARAEAQKAAPPTPSSTAPKPAAGEQPEYVVDFKLQESGQKKTVNGYDTREVVATATVHEKGKSPAEGGMVVSSSMWMAPRINAMKELEDFDRRYAEKLYLPFVQENIEQMAPAMGMYPGLKEALGKMETESVNMDGTAVLTVIRAEITANPNQNAEASKPEPSRQAAPQISLGGLLGGLGRKPAAKEEDAGRPAALMTTNHELLKVSTTVSDADVAIPAGFKETK